jgi:hypothetical protein
LILAAVVDAAVEADISERISSIKSLSLILELLEVSGIKLRDLLSDNLINRIWGCRRHLNISIDIYFDWSRGNERLRMTYRIRFDSTGINHLYILRDWILA